MPDKLSEFRATIAKASQKFDIPEDIIEKVIMKESSGNPKAKSRSGAIGLMQIMPATADMLGIDPSNPHDNIMGGTAFLRKMLDRFGGNLEHALAAYNAGPTAVEQHGGVPPFKETQNYVSGIIGSGDAAGLRRLSNDELNNIIGDIEIPEDQPLIPSSPLSQEQLNARPKIDASAQTALLGKFDPFSNTGTKATAALGGLLGVPGEMFKATSEALNPPPGYPSFRELLGAPPAPISPQDIPVPFQEAQSEEPMAALVGELSPLLLGGPVSKGAKAAKDVAASAGESLGIGSRLRTFASSFRKRQLARLGAESQEVVPKLKASITSDKQKVISILKKSNKTVDFREIVNDDKVLNSIDKLDKAGLRGRANALLNKLAEFEKRGNVSLEEADTIKQAFWDQAFTEAGRRNTELANFYRQLGGRVAKFIEDAAKDPKIRILNEKMSEKLNAITELGKLTKKQASAKSLKKAITTIKEIK